MEDVSAAVSDVDVLPFADEHLFAQAVPRCLVHKAAVSEVLPTALVSGPGGAYRVAVQWPRSHCFYVGSESYDSMILAETIRQTGMVVAHREFGVPIGTHFLIRELSFDADDELWEVGDVPGRLIVDIAASGVSRRGGVVRSMRLDFDVWRSGTRAATGSANFDCITPRVYMRVRGAGVSGAGAPGLGPGLSGPELGERLSRGVGLAPTAEASVWQLVVDRSHPVLFDHPVDHVPGMGLMEGLQQAARSAFGPASRVAAMHMEFIRFIELDGPCELVSHVGECATCGVREVRVVFRQKGLEMGVGRASVRGTVVGAPLVRPQPCWHPVPAAEASADR